MSLQLSLVVWIFPSSLGVICYDRWVLCEDHKNYFKDWYFFNSMNVDQITLNHTTIQNLALQIKYSRHLLQFCWMWIFSWIKLSWHFCSTWDKLGWLNWFWKFFPEGLFSFNPKRFSYSYAWSCSLYERSFTLSLISKWWVFFRVPISPKQSENSNKNCSSLTFTTDMFYQV